MTQDLTVAYVTDAGLFLPTLLSAHSALTRGARPVTMMVVGFGLKDWMGRALDRLADLHPGHAITPVAAPLEWLAQATSPKDFITTTALGRMFLPRLAGGRILYLDGDTLVTGDLTRAAEVDLRGNLIGGVRDYGIGEALAAGKTSALARARASLAGAGGDAGRVDLRDYINSGVLLIDSDAVRATPGLVAAMEDMAAAQGHGTVDQDRINLLFAGRIRHLDPAWNCSWGRLARQRRHMPAETDAPTRSLIVHFHGPNKPWQRLRMSSLRKGGLTLLAYQRELARFRRDFPDLPPLA